MGDQAYPPPSQTRPGYARVANPIHSRYSSADLYAVQHPAPASHNPDFDDHRRDGDDPDSDSDRDSQNGFGTYSDFNALQRPSRESRTLSQAPTLSSLTTAHRPTYEHANSSRYGLKEQSSTLGGGAGETVALPKISRDWDRGEGLNEKNFKRFNKSREKRRRARLVAQEYVDHAAQRWKLVVPVVVAFLVALVLVLYFCIPRVPAVTFRDAKVPSTVFTSTDENPFITSTDPVSYYFNANLILGRESPPPSLSFFLRTLKPPSSGKSRREGQLRTRALLVVRDHGQAERDGRRDRSHRVGRRRDQSAG